MERYTYSLPYDVRELARRLDLSAKRMDFGSSLTEKIYVYRLRRRRLVLAYNPRFFTAERMSKVFFRASVRETDRGTVVSGSFGILPFEPLWLLLAICLLAGITGSFGIALFALLGTSAVYLLVKALVNPALTGNINRILDFIEENLE